MRRAPKADGYCLSSYYCYTFDSSPYCLVRYCPYLPHSISRAWGRLVDPSLILLSVVSYKAVLPCPLIEFDTRLSPLVFVTSSESTLVFVTSSSSTLVLVTSSESSDR